MQYRPRSFRSYSWLGIFVTFTFATAPLALGQGGGGVMGHQDPRPLYITGQVVMADGEPIPKQVEMQRVCAAKGIFSEGFADSEGHFSLQIGGQFNQQTNVAGAGPNVRGVPGVSDVEMTEAASRSTPEQEFWNCDVRASVPGYQSSRIPLVGRKFGDNPDVGTIVLRPMGGVQGTSVSATLDLAPEKAKEEYEKAMESLDKEKWGDAKKHFEKVVKEYDRHAAAWYQLGRLAERNKKLEDAQKDYEKSLEADPQFLVPLLRLSSMALDRGDMNAVLEFSTKILSLNPYDFPSAYYFNGVAHLQMQHMQEAENAARRAIQLDPNNTNPRNYYLMGFVLAQTGRLEEARLSFEKYLELSPDANDAGTVQQVLAQIEKDLGEAPQ